MWGKIRKNKKSKDTYDIILLAKNKIKNIRGVFTYD